MEFSLKLIPISLVVILMFFVQVGFSIKCWDCRSDADAHCSDPFNNETFLITDCDYWRGLDYLPGVLPTMCRKLRQKDNDVWTYIRSCGYHRESGITGHEEFCSTRTGTNNVFIEDCTCNTKDGCNNSSLLKVPTLLILVILSVFVFFKMV